MNCRLPCVSTSVGKKLLMAITGFSFCGFLAAHLAGNLTIYGGKDAFNGYAEHLHALGPLLTVAELVLLSFFLVHVITGLILFLQNLKARPVRYAVNKTAGGRTFGSATMPYTGILMLALGLACFCVSLRTQEVIHPIHLANFFMSIAFGMFHLMRSHKTK